MAAVAGTNISAAASGDEKKSSPKPVVPGQTRPVERDSKKNAGPAPVFKPSEKVGADSAVSFPVDI